MKVKHLSFLSPFAFHSHNNTFFLFLGFRIDFYGEMIRSQLNWIFTLWYQTITLRKGEVPLQAIYYFNILAVSSKTKPLTSICIQQHVFVGFIIFLNHYFCQTIQNWSKSLLVTNHQHPENNRKMILLWYLQVITRSLSFKNTLIKNVTEAKKY